MHKHRYNNVAPRFGGDNSSHIHNADGSQWKPPSGEWEAKRLRSFHSNDVDAMIIHSAVTHIYISIFTEISVCVCVCLRRDFSIFTDLRISALHTVGARWVNCRWMECHHAVALELRSGKWGWGWRSISLSGWIFFCPVWERYSLIADNEHIQRGWWCAHWGAIIIVGAQLKQVVAMFDWWLEAVEEAWIL